MSNVRCQSPTLSLNERSRQALSSVVRSFGASCLGIVIVTIIVHSYPSASRAHPLPHVLPVPDCACGTGAARWVSITQVGLASSSPAGSVLVSTTVWGAPWSWVLSVLLGSAAVQIASRNVLVAARIVEFSCPASRYVSVAALCRDLPPASPQTVRFVAWPLLSLSPPCVPHISL